MLRKCSTVLLALIAVFAALAELSPAEYEKMQREAPEVLLIEVSSVQVDRELAKPPGCGFFDFELRRDIEVKAKAVRVVRSATGIRSGAEVRIKYTSIKRCSGWNGPRSIPLVHEGQRAYAYLQREKGGQVLLPAARGASFSASSPIM